MKGNKKTMKTTNIIAKMSVGHYVNNENFLIYFVL